MSQRMRIGIAGGTGKMGREILSLIEKDSRYQLAFAADRNFSGIKACDVMIDFSTGGLQKAIEFCLKNKTPLVSGATGLTIKEEALLKKASQQIPIFWSSNMSLGIAAMRAALKSLGLIRDFQFSIDEWHHRHKKDSPSGTAKTLAQTLKDNLDIKEVEIQSKRAGGVFGMHRVVAIGDHEYLEFTHQALDRAVFAEGALTAAHWLLIQKPGFYSMDDLLANEKNFSDKRRPRGRK